MAFVLLDNKDWCKGTYYNGKLYFDVLPDNLKSTWKYANCLKNLDVEYAFIYAGGLTLDDVCPQEYLPKWTVYKKKLQAYHNSFKQAKVSLDDNCFFDLVPEQFLMELCEQKVKIIDYVLASHNKPENYNHLLSAQKVLTQISSRKLNIKFENLNKDEVLFKNKDLINKLKSSKPFVEYNIFGSKTGRLTTVPGTFPILTLNKNFRSIIEPQNDLLVELDYNAAELRTLIALTGEEQPTGDIHDWNAKRLGIDRETAKKEMFAWLYGSKQIDSKKYSEIFGLDRLFQEQYNDFKFTNPYGRKIQTDQFHKLNHLVQSTTSDLVLEQLVKINDLLKDKLSYISFTLHDSVVIDLKKEELDIVNKLTPVFSSTKLGTYPVRISAGKNYGSLKRIN